MLRMALNYIEAWSKAYMLCTILEIIMSEYESYVSDVVYGEHV